MCRFCTKPVNVEPENCSQYMQYGFLASNSESYAPYQLKQQHQEVGAVSNFPAPVPPTKTPHEVGVASCSKTSSKLDEDNANERKEVASPANKDEEFRSSPDKDGLAIAAANTPKEVGTLTEISSKNDVAEINLISLIEEQIPRYVLRADTLTDFAGYDHADWIQTPCLPEDTKLDLSPVVIEETLKFFVLCADRVSQMTKTYNDIEAVTRLLEEKERDLELAARIGQSLLDKNKDIELKNELLEEQLSETNEKISQLQHEIVMKDSLLVVYNHDDTESDATPTPSKERLTIQGFRVDTLQKKLKSLEEENVELASVSARLQTDTIECEEKEQSLVKECVRELQDANKNKKVLQDELQDKSEVTLQQQEQIIDLESRNIEVDNRFQKSIRENSVLLEQFQAAQEVQQELAHELEGLNNKYEECVSLLEESQDEVKALRKKQKPGIVRQHVSTFSPYLPEGSLALELEDSLRKNIMPDGTTPADRRTHNQKIMDTAKLVRKQVASRSTSMSSLDLPGSDRSTHSTTSGNESCESIAGSSIKSSLYLSEAELSNAGSQTAETQSDSMYSSCSNLGRPGIPGSNDLETALNRLSVRKSVDNIHELGHKKWKVSESRGSNSPTPCHTPDSYMSTGSGSNLSHMSGSSFFKLPEKLQIVKPMEGSLTLHQWQRLATPHLGGVLDQRPGVQSKGERKLEFEDEYEEHSLSDYEEDGMCSQQHPIATPSSGARTQHTPHKRGNNNYDDFSDSDIDDEIEALSHDMSHDLYGSSEVIDNDIDRELTTTSTDERKKADMAGCSIM